MVDDGAEEEENEASMPRRRKNNDLEDSDDDGDEFVGAMAMLLQNFIVEHKVRSPPSLRRGRAPISPSYSMPPAYPYWTTTSMSRRRRTRITTNTLGMISWLMTVQRRRRTKPL